MKKIIFFAALFVVAFTSNGCSSGDEGLTVNRITLVVDGITKIFNAITVDQSSSEVLIVRGQIGSEVIETIELEIFRNVTGTSAVNSMIFTQNNIEYYAFDGSGASSNVTMNSADRKLRGRFEGNFRTLSGNSKFISNGTFKLVY